MFESQNKQTAVDEDNQGVNFDPGSVRMHTMAEDQQILSGNSYQPMTTPLPEKKASSFFAPKPEIRNDEPASQVSKNPSPFLATSSSPILDKERQIAQVNAPKINASSKAVTNQHEVNWVRIVVILMLVLGIGGFAAGGYIFWITRYSNPAVEPVAEEVNTPVDEIPIEQPEKIEKFLADKPNFLSINVEKVTAEEIKALILKTAGEMKAEEKVSPIEFVITDSNNNPIALNIFNKLMKINFTPTLLSSLGENFSLFVFQDGANVRIGLATSLKNKIQFQTEIKKEEKLLLRDLSPLFLGENFRDPGIGFKDADYKSTAVRYLNVNELNNLSIDYFILGNQSFFATSKNTGRAIIDKVMAENAPVAQ